MLNIQNTEYTDQTDFRGYYLC